MEAAERSQGYYTCEVVTKCFSDENVRKEFMNAYGQGPQQAQDYLEKLGMPPKMAGEVSALQGNDLNLFIGQNVCDYLW